MSTILVDNIKSTYERENRIILSLDGDMKYCMGVLDNVIEESEHLRQKLIWGVKLNVLLAHDGIHLIRMLKEVGLNIMADPKLFDIHTTMYNTASLFDFNGADITTVHGLSLFNAANKKLMSKLACVTVLTSFSDEKCMHLFNRTTQEMVRYLAEWATEAGYGYLVCAPTDLELLSDLDIKKICPGVRPSWHGAPDEQLRTMGPLQTRLEGADYLVVGRPIMRAQAPLDALLRLNEDMGYLG